jgi:hypothetical protein
MKIVRTEPETGGSSRTPREQIEPVFSESDEVEPDAALDASSSEGWELPSGAPPVWGTQLRAFRAFVAAAEQLDSQAAEEQAGGSDEKGGIYTAFFNHGLVIVGKGDDDGDLNSANFDRKVNAIKVNDEHSKLVPLPYGGTNVMPTIGYLDEHYLNEFVNDEDTGQPVPVWFRPKRARTVWTDGAMRDWRQFGDRLAEDHSDEWPQEEWFIAILGEGEAHDDTLQLYQQIAEKHANVHVYSFELVSNAAEIAEDMAVAVLGHKAKSLPLNALLVVLAIATRISNAAHSTSRALRRRRKGNAKTRYTSLVRYRVSGGRSVSSDRIDLDRNGCRD